MTTNNPLLFTTTMALRWRDMDALGHLNNATYFTFMEQARIDWFLEKAQLNIEEEQDGPVIVNTECTFKAALRFPDTIKIETSVTTIKTRSFDMQHTFYSSHNDKIHAIGRVTIVWINYQKEQAITLPSRITSLFSNNTNE